MSNLNSELKQQALMAANDFRQKNSPEFENEIQMAEERAKNYTGNVCPVCWVKDNVSSPLIVVATAQKTVDVYRCDNCESEKAMAKIIPK